MESKLTHGEKRLLELVKKYGRNNTEFYIKEFGSGKQSFYYFCSKLRRKGYLNVKRKSYIEYNYEKND